MPADRQWTRYGVDRAEKSRPQHRLRYRVQSWLGQPFLWDVRACGRPGWRISATRSPMMTQGPMVFPVVTRGIIEPSAIDGVLLHRLSVLPSTTDMACWPILAVHVWC